MFAATFAILPSLIATSITASTWFLSSRTWPPLRSRSYAGSAGWANTFEATRSESAAQHWNIVFLFWNGFVMNPQSMREWRGYMVQLMMDSHGGQYGHHAVRVLQSGTHCLPGRIAVLAHMNCACDFVALDDTFESPWNRISWNFHPALKFNLVGVNRTFEVFLCRSRRFAFLRVRCRFVPE